MIIGDIKDGIVLDHITAGQGKRIYDILELSSLNCTVAMIERAESPKMGSKDIIKIGQVLDIDFDVLGYIDPGITVNIIRDGKVSERRRLKLPQRVVGVLKCKNPRCITSVEQELIHEFKLTDPKNHVYRCIYCEQKATK
jgi:aspartate carbamoyltransferase regulatory subunit